MKRDEFLKTCGYSCLGVIGSTVLFQSCTGTKYLQAEIVDDFLLVGLDAFYDESGEANIVRDFIVVQNPALSHPIAVFRMSDTEFKAFLMRCTHQGTELRLYGDRFECPAHGSEFSTGGSVESGPATKDLLNLPVRTEASHLKIDLR